MNCSVNNIPGRNWRPCLSSRRSFGGGSICALRWFQRIYSTPLTLHLRARRSRPSLERWSLSLCYPLHCWWCWRALPAAIDTFMKSLHRADHHPIRIGDGRERLVTASPVMTKSRAPVEKKQKSMAPHNIMAFVKHLLVVGCLCRFALRSQQGIRLGCAKGQ